MYVERVIYCYIPRLKLFHNGGVVKYEGARDLKSFTDFVDDHISQAPEKIDTKVRAINSSSSYSES